MNTTLTPVILAAGKGTRLRPGGLPKCLSEMPDGRTILRRQLDALDAVLGVPEREVTIVVGYRAEDIAEAAPAARYVYNDAYDVTNTAKSLQRALQAGPPRPRPFARRKPSAGVLWLNGDVVFDPMVLAPFATATVSSVTVNTASVADEEVKYTVDDEGFIDELGKTSSDRNVRWLGEAVGINSLLAEDIPSAMRYLSAASPQDYYEDALARAIAAGALRMRPLDATGMDAVEVDTPEDLQSALQMLS